MKTESSAASPAMNALRSTAPASIGPAADSAALRRQHRAVLAAVTLLILLPFVGKPLHIDDPLFVWTAQHIQSNPWDFYGFKVNWFGFDSSMSDMMKNPPLASYYLAAIGALFGFGEIALHAAGLVPAVAAVLGTYELARLYCARPFLAALLALTTPVFVLCATTVMCDVPLLAFWCWAMVFWRRGLLENRTGLLLLGAVFATLACLTKYFGMCLIPLLLLDALETRRRPTWSMLWLALPVVVVAVYQQITASLYGHGLVSDAGMYAILANELQGSPRNLEGAFRILVFLGGCVVGIVLLAPRLCSSWMLVVGTVFSIVLGVIAIQRGWADVLKEVVSLDQREGWILLAHVALFLGAGITAVALVAAELIGRRSKGTFTLAAWMLGTLVFAGFVNWMINGRSFLPLVPALGILAARRLDQLEGPLVGPGLLGELGWSDGPPLALGLVTALLAAAGDYTHANAARTAAGTIAAKYVRPDERFVFVGHWGFQYYIEQYGAVPLNSQNMDFNPGDLIAVPRSNTNNLMMPTELAAVTDVIDVPLPLPVTTMRKSENAGFYGSNSHGRLPWCVGRRQRSELSPTDDQYLIQTVRKSFQLRLEPPDVR